MEARALARRARLKEKARTRIALIRETPEYRQAVRLRLLMSLHAKQRSAIALIDEGERYISLCCGRRGGKTRLLATLIILFMLDLEFGQEVVFVAPTLKRGKELIWAEVDRIEEDFNLGYKKLSAQGTMRTPRGGLFRIVGLDNKKQVGKIARGGNSRAFLADEVQEFAHLLQGLIEAATPALGQTRGLFISSGTPGFSRRGYWFDICQGKDGFRNVTWTLFDNPYLGRDANEIVEEEIARKAWPRDHPTLLREWFAKWLDDLTRKVCDLAAWNIVDTVPEYDRATWRHVLAIDYGNSPDPCAFVVLAAHPHQNYVAVLHAEYGERMTSDAICARTNELRMEFRCKRIVGDSASGGKTFIQDFNERHARKAGFHMIGADKADKGDSIDLVNTELRTIRLVVLKSGAQILIDEMQQLEWDEDHSEFLPGADHAYDGLRYGIRAVRAFFYVGEKKDPTEEELELQRIKARNSQAERDQRGGFFE